VDRVADAPKHNAKESKIMSTKRQSFGEKIKSWREMQGNLKSQLGTAPYLKDAHDQLEQGIASADDLQLRLIALRGSLADAVRQKRTLIRSNESLHTRIGAALHFQHGPASAELIQFGLKPRAVRKKAKPKPPAETPPPTETPPPGSNPPPATGAGPHTE
jgi:hypothetical protein